MASVWKHPNSPFWTACFTDLDGKRKKRSTKETNRRKAEKLAEQYEEAARKRRTFSQVRTVLQDLHREITGEELKSVTVREHVKNWLAEKKDETKPATMHFYDASSTKFLDFLGERADQEISLVTRGDGFVIDPNGVTIHCMLVTSKVTSSNPNAVARQDTIEPRITSECVTSPCV